MPGFAKARVCVRGMFSFALLFLAALPVRAQLSFQSAIDLALENNPRIKSAQEDVKRTAAALTVTKDIFIPSIVTAGGLGTAYGITLSVPTIFTVNAQSLVYSAQQRFYIRAARGDLASAQLALADARSQTEEDTAITYISLDAAQRTRAALQEQFNFATRLVAIVQDRVNGKLDSELDLMKARRTAVQLKLQTIRTGNDVAAIGDHLGQLTGLSADKVMIDPASIPAIADHDDDAVPNFPVSPGILAAEANARAKLERAQGDTRYTWRPQLAFGAQYGRISPIENVSTFYNLHGNYNTASIGLQIQFPILDRVRKAAGQEATADAVRTVNDLRSLRFDEAENRKKLLRALPELKVVAELAALEQSIAENELNSTLVQLRQGGAGPVLTPKEEMNARIQERQKYLDLLDARLQLEKAQISFLRQSGDLEKWLRSQVSTAP